MIFIFFCIKFDGMNIMENYPKAEIYQKNFVFEHSEIFHNSSDLYNLDNRDTCVLSIYFLLSNKSAARKKDWNCVYHQNDYNAQLYVCVCSQKSKWNEQKLKTIKLFMDRWSLRFNKFTNIIIKWNEHTIKWANVLFEWLIA